MLTSHFDSMNARETQAFLQTTRDFMERLEGALIEVMKDEAGHTLRVLSERLAPNFGSWADDAGLLICWPILGHLERMVARGQAICEVKGSIHQYRRLEVKQ